MIQSNLNQAGVDVAYKTTFYAHPLQDRRAVLEAAIAAYLECVEGWQPIETVPIAKRFDISIGQVKQDLEAKL